MGKVLAFLSLFFIATFATAQTQHGIVKTRGRVVNGQVVPGTKLSGATITLNIGNPQVSQAQGTFSFNVPAGKSFSLVSAKKQGYTLADPEYTRRTFSYSAKNPFYVVLEDETQRQADIKEATDKVRKTLKRELRKREDELDELRESNAITQAKYDSLRIEFVTHRQSSEALVNEMAERFAAIDYDQLDEFNRQVQQYIEEGELLKADSLINIRGSLEERYARVKEQETVNTQREEEIRAEQESLTKSQELTQREKEDLMSDLYAKHTIYLQAYQQDSALYCLKMRADLDTTSVSAVWDYALLCMNQKKYSESETYFRTCLRQNISRNDLYAIAEVETFLGLLYQNSNYYVKSEKYYKLALEICECQVKEYPDIFRPLLAFLQSSLGCFYSDIHDYTNSEYCLKLSLENMNQLFAQDSKTYRVGLALAQMTLGNLYNKICDYSNSEFYLKLSEENYKQLFDQCPEDYRSDWATICNVLGGFYLNLHDYTRSIEYLKKALRNYDILFGCNSERYCDDLALVQYNLGLAYFDIHDLTNCEYYYLRALENYEQLFKLNPNVFRAKLAMVQNGLGLCYSFAGNWESSEKYLVFALQNREELFGLNPDAYREDLAIVQMTLGGLYEDMHRLNLGEKYYRLALNNYEILFDENPNVYRGKLSASQSSLGGLYHHKGDFESSEKYFKQAVENREFLFSIYPNVYREMLALSYGDMVSLYEDMDNVEQYDFYLKNALQLYQELYQQDPSKYIETLVEKKNRYTWRLLVTGYVVEAMENAKETLTLEESNELSIYNYATCCNSIAYIYVQNELVEDAFQMINQAIALVPEEPEFYDSRGEILLMQSRNDEALEMWKKVLELNPNFLDNYPDGTELSNGLKKLGLI